MKKAKIRRRCFNCGSQFEVNPRIGRKHRHCAAPACRRASKRTSQERWLRKPENAGYFKGPANALRAKLWRAANPKKRTQTQRTMQRLMDPALAAALKSCGVQDLNERHLALVLGLVSRLARGREQETIAREIRRLMFAGYAVLRGPDESSRRSGG